MHRFCYDDRATDAPLGQGACDRFEAARKIDRRCHKKPALASSATSAGKQQPTGTKNNAPDAGLRCRSDLQAVKKSLIPALKINR
jgi:hypothetical protein